MTRSRTTMKVTAIALFCLSSCAAHNVRTGVKETKSARASDYIKLSRTYDDFEPQIQNICNDEKTLDIDGCEVSYVLEDLDTTNYDHIFDTQCGEYEIVITFDLEDGMPVHVNKVAAHSEHWAELIPLPEIGEEGCNFALVTSLDIDPAKVERDSLEHPRKLLESNGDRRSFRAGEIDFFPIPKPAGRKLASCSRYNVIKLGIIFDSIFCQENGGNEGSARAAIHFIIQTMNQWYNAYPLCIDVESTYIGGTCNHNQDPLQSVMRSAPQHCGQDGDLTSQFKKYVKTAHGGPKGAGSDAMHLVFGGDPVHLRDAGGCAFKESLCSDYAVGTNGMGGGASQHDNAALLAHELGHTLSLDDFYPEDKTYLMGEGTAGFKPERMVKMKNYVEKNSGCTATSDGNGSHGDPPSGVDESPDDNDNGEGWGDDNGEGWDDDDGEGWSGDDGEGWDDDDGNDGWR